MANVKLSQAEMELVTNAEIILTKNRIIEKVYELFGNLSEQYKMIVVKSNLPEEVISISPKISKGEYYENLPWVMLDYPRYFKEKDFFGIRTFFWWGNFFSITLHLKGKYREQLEILNSKFQIDDWFICVNEDEWQHHFGADNYLPLFSLTQEQMEKLPFIKLAAKISLQNWSEAEKKLADAFHQLIQLF